MPHPQAVYELFVGALTDVGRARKHNEDYIGYHVPDAEQVRRSYGALFVVCDGVGGSAAGEVASQQAVHRILQMYYALPPHEPPLERLVKAIQQANLEIYQLNLQRTDGREMATTVVAAVILGSKMYVAHAGDSRVYLVRDGQIVQLTEDHSWVAEMVRSGDLTPEEAERHPWKNRITRSLGASKSVRVDAQTVDVLTGDRIVLCSDGLTRHVKDAEIADFVSRYPADQAVRRLVDLANKRGGKDNISVIVAELLPEEEAKERARLESLSAETTQVMEPSAPVPVSFLKRYILAFSILAVLALVMGGMGVYLLSRGTHETVEVQGNPSPAVRRGTLAGVALVTVSPQSAGVRNVIVTTPSAEISSTPTLVMATTSPPSHMAGAPFTLSPTSPITSTPTQSTTSTLTSAHSITATPTFTGTPSFTFTPTLTMTPTSTPTPSPRPMFAWVKSVRLYLRKHPTTRSEAIIALDPYTQLRVLEGDIAGESGNCRQGRWLHVQVMEGKAKGQKGFVCAEDVTWERPSVMLPAPKLIKPRGGSFHTVVTFEWKWEGPPLEDNQAFELRIWKEGEQVHYGAYDVRKIKHNTRIMVDISGAYGVKQGGPGTYYWTVAVVEYGPGYPEEPPRQVGEEAKPFTFTYLGPEPTPTWTPTWTPTPTPTWTPTWTPTSTPTPTWTPVSTPTSTPTWTPMPLPPPQAPPTPTPAITSEPSTPTPAITPELPTPTPVITSEPPTPTPAITSEP